MKMHLTIRHRKNARINAFLFISLCTISLSSAAAATRSPTLSYGGFNTAIGLKMAAYSSWVSAYSIVGCGFDQWSWWGTTNSISGIPNTGGGCRSGHIAGTWSITKICPTGYYPDNSSAPTICTLPDDVVDQKKENGEPDNSLSCSATTPSKKTGNPINFAVGNKFQEETDYIGHGSFPLRFTRAYNSQDGLWRHNYSTHLRIAPDNIVLVAADGRESYFSLVGNIATPEPNELGRLTQENGQWVYSSPRQEQFNFDNEGRLNRWARSLQEYQTLTYDNDLKVHVADANGNTLSFTVNTAAQGQPLSLSAGETQVNYTYNSQKHISNRSITRGGLTEQRTYHYESSNDAKLLTGITDERGIRYATWAYDAQGRATSSEHSGGAEKVLISYNTDGSSTVTNELGQITIYRFQVIQGVKRITAIEGNPTANCPNSNSTFTYDARGLLKTKTDNKGFITSYDYNERGLEITRTEASGTPQARTTTTTWHATLDLPLTVTEPGRVTTYTYDAQGRQLSQTSASTAL